LEEASPIVMESKLLMSINPAPFSYPPRRARRK
jgi:hypothetical protein